MVVVVVVVVCVRVCVYVCVFKVCVRCVCVRCVCVCVGGGQGNVGGCVSRYWYGFKCKGEGMSERVWVRL